MPSRSTKKMRCVFYALAFGFCCQSIVVAQDNYQRGATRQSFSGIVDRLAQQPSASASEGTYGSHSDRGASSPLRVAQDDVVALRPQPMSVRQTSFESVSTDRSIAPRGDHPSRRALDRLNAEEHLQSFIDREATAAPAEDKINPADMISRIGVNLMFVLALAVGGILLFKQIQKGKLGGAPETPASFHGLKIDQVLQVSRGVSLYLIDSAASKVLVAVDGGGIKSVNVLPPRFDEGLDSPETFAAAIQAQPSEPTPQKEATRASRRRVDETSSSEIDQNLIKLLLSKSKQAA